MSRRVLVLMVAAGVLLAACSGAGSENSDTPREPTAAPAEDVVVEQQRPASAASPAPSPTPELTLGQGDAEAAQDIELAPLGTFVVARENAGIRRQAANGVPSRLEIPVYAIPFGAPQTVLAVNAVDGTENSISLTNWAGADGALVMRVIAGSPDDDWLIVQAPTRPHNQYVWVRRNDFDFGFTTMRIEIDLANAGRLTLLDGGRELLRTPIVHGRESRETPTHLTYVERGIRGIGLSPAYGSAILSMASFSEVLGTFGGGMPSNFLHGTNQPQLMGQRVSSGEIRVPNEVLEQIIETITPGTPVLMFNSSVAVDDKESILERTLELASTVDFIAASPAVAVDGTTFVTPQLWRRCSQEFADQLLCRNVLEDTTEGRYAYITARPGAGVFNDEVGAEIIPVFDAPGGEPRMLVHEAADRIEWRLPLRHPSPFRKPLVLWPLEETPDGEWIRVQAPVQPQRQSVWVRSADFEFGWTDYRIEIDIAGEGSLTLFDGDTEVISNLIVSGRETRPTPLGETYIDQVIDGTTLSPAYGPYVLTLPIYNEVLGSFGGGLAQQLIHGTNQPELMGQRVASGHVRIPNDVLTFIAERPGGLVGTRVVTVDSTGGDRATAIEREESRPWRPARTTDPADTTIRVAPIGF